MSFLNNLKKALNVSVTENGAIGYRTTGKKLLDINFAVSSLRNESEDSITARYEQVLDEDMLLALKWLFYASDVREGLGERRLFRICFAYIAEKYPQKAKALIKYIPEYNRWDNMLCLLDIENEDIENEILEIIKNQLDEDIQNLNEGKPVSLCAKWLPSINTSSQKTRAYARKIIKALGCNCKEYRKMLSMLREELKVTEKLMSRGDWDKIDYEHTPSRANLIYNKAFLRNDEQRRNEYLKSLSKGEVKINAGVLYPHDIVHKYIGNNISYYSMFSELGEKDETLEQLWKSLGDKFDALENTICVSDGSGSMYSCIGRTYTRAIEVAVALAIYCGEKCTGEFKNHYITFSHTPKLVELSGNLKNKIETALKNNEVGNTNIEAVFDLILETAIRSHSKQDEIPKNIIILSDMEFDFCAVTQDGIKPSNALFNIISKKYEKYGYKLPRLIFWNIMSRTNTIPLKENDMGVTLVSGFSVNVLKMVMSNELDPYKCLINTLNSDRYTAIEQAVSGL